MICTLISQVWVVTRFSHQTDAHLVAALEVLAWADQVATCSSESDLIDSIKLNQTKKHEALSPINLRCVLILPEQETED